MSAQPTPPSVEMIEAVMTRFAEVSEQNPISTTDLYAAGHGMRLVLDQILRCHRAKAKNFRSKIDEANVLINELIGVSPIHEDQQSRDYCTYCSGSTDLSKSNAVYRHFIHEDTCPYQRAVKHIQETIRENAEESKA